MTRSLVAMRPAGEPTRDRAPAAGEMGVPRWSPDGSQIAYVGGLMSDESVIGGDVYLVSVAGWGTA